MSTPVDAMNDSNQLLSVGELCQWAMTVSNQWPPLDIMYVSNLSLSLGAKIRQSAMTVSNSWN